MVEIPSRQGRTEPVKGLCGAPNLREQLGSGAAQPTAGAVQDIHRSGKVILPRNPHRQIGEAVMVEVGPHIPRDLRQRLRTMHQRRVGRCRQGRQEQQGNDQGCPSERGNPSSSGPERC
jgi:hypothetical protein